MSDIAEAASGLESLASLPRTPRMPVLFVGHGSPMNVIQDSAFRRGWQAMGLKFGKDLPRPSLILCVSAHWITKGWWLTGMAKPATIHDFGGFPQELFAQQYPAPGAPDAARAIAHALAQPPMNLDTQRWGFDHGSWSVLKPMFPAADIPLLQLSMDYSRPPGEHLALGRKLRQLRERGVLIVGSGNVVHNLRAIRREVPDNQAYDWAIEFDAQTAQRLEQRDTAGLADFLKWGGATAQLAHPTYDHYLPLIYAAGATDPGEPVQFFNNGFQAASISMRSVLWGGARA